MKKFFFLFVLLAFNFISDNFDSADAADDPQYEACIVPQNCGNQTISFPFFIQGQQESYCGYPGFSLSCDPNGRSILNLSGQNYVVREIFYHNRSVIVSNAALLDPEENGCITPVPNLTLSSDFKIAEGQNSVVLLYNCRVSSSVGRTNPLLKYKIGCYEENQTNSVLAIYESDRDQLDQASRMCGPIGDVVVANTTAVDVYMGGSGENEGMLMREVLRRGFMLTWLASDCGLCESSGGKCGFMVPSYHFWCFCPDRPHALKCFPPSGLSKQQKLGLGLGIGFVVLFAMMGLAIIMWCRKQKRAASRNIDDPNMNMNMEDPEGASGYLGVLVFSYKELTEATNNFDADRELGDGGFGTVYHGKLKDGREVAVKRLYEHNYKRLEQFINEIQILAGLRHKNLVSLYGCTSRRSRELLLVYEYIPNGTVADHLHGDRAKTSPLTWPIRLSVAIETARALAYLHASDIVHRDVKTNNILLDNNFCVKVADFGLSRLFPSDVTHVSTAPQGTPGYVDPEYHQCYQLTSKSDVYSFGVVLVELLSSMPAVDITRHRHEINLSNLAISKIQKQAYNELIDQDLGFDSDTRVRTMTIAVAELAFECLQQDKEMRPTMDEVLERLMRIEDGKIETKVVGGSELSMSTVLPPPPSPECDEIGLLKNIKQEQPPSPNAVTENWLSSTSTTPNFSG
ncbi:LEAF RUST 10 DISEASE-RESISTANCE LOCUS RECEPTOR-LIKE PROTEIN KINASE-like 1.2 isoform X1 [Humulus lupulus]|uniref:LEAF RUST 10 DISEASE-RESISTANCE LOCUS RECEPTOR-LIKE PROTEIN KINASE-like 1.2 isoform X1 n=1 Tax=Humulus lupulus TaxID=3486 RepID=UPI002B413494|nr:LEAF RUST 10 DISEASE-RESISTANCE LOCUS RECEPTOR-LIKE PROTEIN KINASE-like 1.2 isoform X1 [Humulus lupulus]